jgi:hypothetical protein
MPYELMLAASIIALTANRSGKCESRCPEVGAGCNSPQFFWMKTLNKGPGSGERASWRSQNHPHRILRNGLWNSTFRP